VTGPVHAEKSTKAVQIARRYDRLHAKVVLVRPKRSVRKHERPGFLVTKSGLEYPSTEVDSTAGIAPAAYGADVVWIDEPALFPDEERLYDVVNSLRRTTPFLVSGLSATSEGEPFGTSMPRLMAVADKVILLKADCDFCGRFNIATRSICLQEKDGQVLVGGTDVYKAACSKCWSRRST
jgi:thymidine kinase